MKAGLYICPTPIGNLEDITIRVLSVLREVDLIAAEDTRHSLKLLNKYEIKKPLISYHEHNIKSRGEELIKEIIMGKSIALISDAGMPGISDPGHDLICLAIESGLHIEVLPGATASITALVLSGLNTDKFIFEGFLEVKSKKREEELRKIKDNKYSTIIYEAPHRIKSLLAQMEEIIGERRISISRELSKKFEETFRGTITEAREYFSDDRIRGEFVLVLEGKKEEEQEIDIKFELKKLIDDGMKNSAAIKEVSKRYGIPKNKVYEECLKL